MPRGPCCNKAGSRDCPISEDGYVFLQDVLRRPTITLLGVTDDEIVRMIEHNKERYTTAPDRMGRCLVAAWSGHSIQGVVGPAWELCLEDTPNPLAHGSYTRHRESILRQRVLRGTRDSHWQDPSNHQRRWRNDLELKVVIDSHDAYRRGCRFRKTGNGGILCGQDVPPGSIRLVEAWDDLPDGLDRDSAAAATGGSVGLWGPKDRDNSLTEEVAGLAQQLANTCLGTNPGQSIPVEPTTLATEVLDPEEADAALLKEDEYEAASEVHWSASEEEPVIVQALSGREEAVKMEPEARSAPGPATSSDADTPPGAGHLAKKLSRSEAPPRPKSPGWTRSAKKTGSRPRLRRQRAPLLRSFPGD